ncbi:TPA: PTS sugar transporter subunit IIA [Yersinia enterocolitica]|uniref:PTS sugar transporter subunit IIA n=1 Tax=Yersinia enterocolitica TaxID=630 RepID=UPI000327E347|nr:PTS sugar transporter subunit IIA [Yersinia enterocolitica]EKN3325645.1 PTS sugar transporter subunit IIA [Yersinia enterocolitica]EKN3349396.1 PTS sugar transporter subunit IIA [Yersinia enterocolitica]EKN3358259.1 PTS sugar transporter subunit IIA [Yersinia enterocolitica]EKN3364557.1 PTS sugar transporter subunit IIA [Yersinia enterocolitica]EKN3381116.1 PTS sugar transporter subunit IIA [Yersinia enterocolitica]
MLKTLLTPDVIQVVSQAKDWRDAIAISCQPLIDNRSIEARYVEAIYRSHEAIGPYYVVGPGIAMPHARPEEGANKLSLALTVLTEGVTFHAEGNDPVKLLIVLAATDSTSHIEAISQLAQLFDNDNDVQALLNAKTQQDILSVIARY